MPGVYLGRGLLHLIVLACVLLRRGSFKTQSSVAGKLDTCKQAPETTQTARPPGIPGQTASAFPRRHAKWTANTTTEMAKTKTRCRMKGPLAPIRHNGHKVTSRAA